MPKEKEIISLKWVYTVKHISDGSFQMKKAMLVAKGCVQQL